MPADGKIIYGGWLVRGFGDSASQTPIAGGAIYTENGRIAVVGTFEDLRRKYPHAVQVGDPRYVVIPGLINAHSHGRGLTTFQMGQPDEPLETRVLEILFRTEWNSGEGPGAAGGNRGHDPHLDTLHSCLKQIASGITTTLHSDIYVEGPTERHAERARGTLKAYRDSGIRTAFALGIRDRYTYMFMPDQEFLASLPADLRAAPELRPLRCDMSFAEYYALLKDLAREFPEVSFQLSPWNPVWCSDELMKQLAAASARDGWRVHTHLVETKHQADYARRTYDKSWAAHLRDIGLLSPRFSGAHGAWLDPSDLEIVKSSGAQLVYNPSSNLRLSSGIAPVRDFLASNIPVAFGLDSLSMNDDEDMFQDLRLGQQIQCRPGVGSSTIAAGAMFKMATIGGAAVTGIEGIGSLIEGNWADAVLLSLPEIEGGVARHPLVEVLLRRAKAAHVRTVVIGGKVMIENGRWVGRDADAVRRALSAAVGPERQPSPMVGRLKNLVQDRLGKPG